MGTHLIRKGNFGQKDDDVVEKIVERREVRRIKLEKGFSSSYSVS